MNLMLIMQGAKAVGSAVGGIMSMGAVKDAAKAQKETANKYYEYNKGQLNKAYEKAIGNTMTNYVMDRMNMAEEYSKMKSDLNIVASQSGINLADSSFTNDAQNQLDLEFETNLQDSYTNLIGQMTDLAMDKTTQAMQLAINRNTQINQINQAYDKVKSETINKITGDLLNFGSTALDAYMSNKAKNDLSNKTKTLDIPDTDTSLKLNHFGSTPNYFGNEFSGFKW